MKNTIATLMGVLLATGGTSVVYEQKLGAEELLFKDTQIQLNTAMEEKEILVVEKENLIIEKNQAIQAKHDVLKDYINSQVRLKEVPPVDLTFASLDEINQAYLDLAQEKKIVLKLNDDVFTRLRERAVSEGTACTIAK